jgi:hypothetical protein
MPRSSVLPIKQVKEIKVERMTKNMSFATAMPVPMTNFQLSTGG